MKVSAPDKFARIKKASINVGHPGSGLTYPAQQFYKGVVLWSTLSHPNILTLVGVQEHSNKQQLIIVSEFMVGGNIMEYISENHTNRLEPVRDFAIALPANSPTKIK